jgi:2-dehydropantoate 2-reductase
MNNAIEKIAIIGAGALGATYGSLLYEWYKVLGTLNQTGKTSMLQDVEAGRPTEVEMLAGTVIRLGKLHGVPTPVNQKLYDDLKRIKTV